MKPSLRLAAGAVLVHALCMAVQVQAQPVDPGDADAAPATPSALDADLFYQLLLGELEARDSEPATGFALVLDAARKTNDPALYQRAVEIAFQGRSGDAALQAARAWKQAFPQSREANRYVLQILLALNQVAESAAPLRTDIALAQPAARNAALALVPRLYARVSDKKLAAATVEQTLAEWLADPATAGMAWTTVGRLRLAAGDASGAIEAAQRGQAADPQAEGPALLALEIMDPKHPLAEPIVRRYLEAKPLPELRMAYARALLDGQRYAEAQQQLQQVTRDKPALADAWLAQGTLQAEDNQLDAAERSLRKYLELAQADQGNEDRSRGLAQAYVQLARIAEKRGHYAAATAWLDKIEGSQDLLSAQSRRASILARQGKLQEARQLIRDIPDRTPAGARAKLTAEVQLLREQKQYKAAHDLLARAAAKEPNDVDLLYEQAMLAEKLNDMGEMERLLRQVIALKPDYHHAYNALGYSLADRGIRLPEARRLVEKALEYAPGDPFISDSLGWVEFRMGNKAEALRILQTAYQARPDAEIAAHLGEVLWSLGEREKAQSIWKQGLLLNGDNETLLATLKRLRVPLQP